MEAMRIVSCVLVVLFLASVMQVAEAEEPKFEVVLLGTGIPLPNPARGTASTLVVAGERTILVDTGRRVLENLAAANQQLVDYVLFTHFHSDHIADFGEYMVNRGIAGAETPQHVLGPAGTRALVDDFLKVYSRDTEYRIAHHGEHWPANAMTAEVEEFEPGVILDDDGLRIIMFAVDHEPIEPAVGYRIEFGGKSVVISGDTKASPGMVEAARGADVLVHEVMNVQMLNAARAGLRTADPRRGEMLEDMMTHHAGTLDVAAIARDAGVKQLVLTHLVPSIAPTDAAERVFVQGMSAVYSGPIVVGRDGMRIRP